MTIETIDFAYRSASLTFTVWDGTHASMSNVYSVERGKGHATKLIGIVTKYADDNGLNIFTAAQSFGEGGLTTGQLRIFYEKFGFIVQNDTDPEWIEMERSCI
jgi:GNAT superfamily N-acetyltransferase